MTLCCLNTVFEPFKRHFEVRFSFLLWRNLNFLADGGLFSFEGWKSFVLLLKNVSRSWFYQLLNWNITFFWFNLNLFIFFQILLRMILVNIRNKKVVILIPLIFVQLINDFRFVVFLLLLNGIFSLLLTQKLISNLLKRCYWTYLLILFNKLLNLFKFSHRHFEINLLVNLSSLLELSIFIKDKMLYLFNIVILNLFVQSHQTISSQLIVVNIFLFHWTIED